MSIQVRTTEYEFSHGKKPRGYGHWAFFFDNITDPGFIEGWYADAKKKAIEYAKDKNYSRIKVGP